MIMIIMIYCIDRNETPKRRQNNNNTIPTPALNLNKRRSLCVRKATSKSVALPQSLYLVGLYDGALKHLRKIYIHIPCMLSLTTKWTAYVDIRHPNLPHESMANSIYIRAIRENN